MEYQSQNSPNAVSVLYFAPPWVRSSPTDSLSIINSHIDGQGILCDSWLEFLTLFTTHRPRLIVIHDTVIHRHIGDFSNLVKMLKGIHTIDEHYAKVAVVITHRTSQQYIQMLIKAGISGIVPNCADFGKHEAIFAVIALCNNDYISYWPQHILKLLPDETLPNIVYFHNGHHAIPKCTAEISQILGCTYTMPSTWGELSKELAAGAKYLAFHITMIASTNFTISEFIDSIYVLAHYMGDSSTIKIGVVINKDTTTSVIKLLQNSRASGILLDINNYHIDDVVMSTNALISGISYWPKNIINKLPGNIKKQSTSTGIDITLTNRQKQILELVCNRGLSNKKIASSLNITENTVKVHVSAILKLCGVKNRTQLALMVKNSLNQ